MLLSAACVDLQYITVMSQFYVNVYGRRAKAVYQSNGIEMSIWLVPI